MDKVNAASRQQNGDDLHLCLESTRILCDHALLFEHTSRPNTIRELEITAIYLFPSFLHSCNNSTG